MTVTLNNESLTLQTKERNVGSEAPAIRVKMLNGETKVIGMMADKVQVMITLPYGSQLNTALYEVISKHQDKALIYLLSPEIISLTSPEMTSTDFSNFSKKFGVFVSDTLCAVSVFIINKDGEVVYKEIAKTIEGMFDSAAFDKALGKTIAFKKKGHTHENWMGV